MAYGQETNQQNNQQVAQTPALPSAQDPGWMQKSDPNDLSFLFNEESGQLEIVPKSQLKSVPEPTDSKFQVAVAQATTTSGAVAAEDNQQQPESLDRLGRLENGFAQLIAYLQGQEQTKLNNLTPQQIQSTQDTQPDYSELNLSDPSILVALINTSVQNALKQYTEPMQQAVDQVKVKNSFDYAAAKYGQDFLAVLPKIQILIQNGILKSDPNTSFENLYLSFKQMEALTGNTYQQGVGNTAKSDSTIQAVNGLNNQQIIKQPQTVQGLVQKSNQLSTETGGVQRSIINQDKPRVNSIDDAVNQAWDQLFGSKV